MRPQISSMSTSPPRPRPELSKDVRGTMVDGHKAGIIYRTTSKMFGEKVKTVGVIFEEWNKWIKVTINHHALKIQGWSYLVEWGWSWHKFYTGACYWSGGTSVTKNTTFNRIHLRSPAEEGTCWGGHILDKNPLRQQTEMCHGWMFQHDNDPTCASNWGGSWSFAKQQPWNLLGRERCARVSEVCKQETNYKKHLTAVFPRQVFLASAKSCGFFFFRVFSWYSVSLH